MAKRRTRKQKEAAKHQFKISWKPNENEAKRGTSEANVKGQFRKSEAKKPNSKPSKNYSNYTAKSENLAVIRKDIVKSLILAGMIVASEIMIYLFLH
jgi:hypothetical protein